MSVPTATEPVQEVMASRLVSINLDGVTGSRKFLVWTTTEDVGDAINVRGADDPVNAPELTLPVRGEQFPGLQTVQFLGGGVPIDFTAKQITSTRRLTPNVVEVTVDYGPQINFGGVNRDEPEFNSGSMELSQSSIDIPIIKMVTIGGQTTFETISVQRDLTLTVGVVERNEVLDQARWELITSVANQVGPLSSKLFGKLDGVTSSQITPDLWKSFYRFVSEPGDPEYKPIGSEVPLPPRAPFQQYVVTPGDPPNPPTITAVDVYKTTDANLFQALDIFFS